VEGFLGNLVETTVLEEKYQEVAFLSKHRDHIGGKENIRRGEILRGKEVKNDFKVGGDLSGSLGEKEACSRDP